MKASIAFYSVLLFGILFLSLTYIIQTNNRVVMQSAQAPCFALLTDFGYDFAVGSLKATILNKIPSARIIDLDHSIQKFSVISANFVLLKSYHYFPKGTIFVCIIDPGVGTAREPLCVATSNYAFIGPNNGIFDGICEQEKNCSIYEIDSSYLSGKSNTFHGRDLFVPAAVDFAQKNLQHFKYFNRENFVHLARISDQAIITYIDSFGNIKLNKSADSFIIGQKISVCIGSNYYQIPFCKTFNEVQKDQLLMYKGSNDAIEIAVNQGSAAQKLNVQVGDSITF